MKILISGAGIAGPCLAYWLRHHGFEPTIVERAPRLRSGGYVIDFWGTGFDVAERMGIVPEILEKGYQIRELRQVGRDGRRISGFDVGVFDPMTGGRFTSLPRSELAASLHGALDGTVETIFGDSISRIDDTAGGVQVQFEKGAPRSFDLVVGADGLHSQVRRLVFGAEERFEHFLGLKVAAFSIQGYRPRDELVYVVHTAIGQQVGRFAMHGDRTMFLFVFADRDPAVPDDLAEQKAVLRRHFGDSGWECPRILEAMDGADELYFDRVSQIRMDSWSRGRVALVGDAAFCVSLLAGQGSALAMTAAYVLAGELARADGDADAGFMRYEERLRDFLASKQGAAVRLAPFFAPPSRWAMFLRNQVMKLLSLRWVAERAVGRDLQDHIELPSY